MSNIQTKKLYEIAIVTAGQSPESINYSDNEGTPFLQGNRTFGIKYPKIDVFTKKITKLAKKGDILVSVRAPVGDLNVAHCDICIGRGLASINAKDSDNQFLYYILKHNINSLIKKSNGSIFQSINRSDLENLEVVFPKKNQKIISKLLSALDDKIELNNKINS